MTHFWDNCFSIIYVVGNKIRKNTEKCKGGKSILILIKGSNTLLQIWLGRTKEADCCVAFQRMPLELGLYQKGCLKKKPLVLMTDRDIVSLHLILITARNSCLSSSITLCHFPKKGNSLMVTIPFPKGLKPWQFHLSFKCMILQW